MGDIQNANAYDQSDRASSLLEKKHEARSKSMLPGQGLPINQRQNWVKNQNVGNLSMFRGNQAADDYQGEQKNRSLIPPIFPKSRELAGLTKKIFKEIIDQQAADGLDFSDINSIDPREILEQVGLKLKQEMEDCDFTAYHLLLNIAILKDFVDLSVNLLTLGTLGTVLNFITTPIMWAVFYIGYFRKIARLKWRIKQEIIKMFWKWTTVGIVIESTPLVNLFPYHTINIILMKISIDKKRKKLEEEYNKVQKLKNEL